MNRPGFTVETVEGSCYDANNLRYSWQKRFAGYGLSFTCSGNEMSFAVLEIKEIRFIKNGPTYCNECDGPIPNRQV